MTNTLEIVLSQIKSAQKPPKPLNELLSALQAYLIVSTGWREDGSRLVRTLGSKPFSSQETLVVYFSASPQLGAEGFSFFKTNGYGDVNWEVQLFPRSESPVLRAPHIFMKVPTNPAIVAELKHVREPVFCSIGEWTPELIAQTFINDLNGRNY
jgi:hypothetical protein